MNSLTIIYWTRVLLGVVAGLISTLIGVIIGEQNLFNGVSIALLIYIITYYVYKPLFLAKVEKPQKIFTTGVFAYFLTWIVVFGLFSTLAGPNISITSPAPNTVFSAGSTASITAKITNQFSTPFSGANVTATSPKGDLIQMTETSPGVYSGAYNVTTSDPAGQWKIKVASRLDGEYREALTTVVVKPGP
jgi:uncharacterized membrane protein YfcA